MSVGCIEEVNGCWDAMIAPKIAIDLDAERRWDAWKLVGGEVKSRFAVRDGS
jgi:hypothetical protein